MAGYDPSAVLRILLSGQETGPGPQTPDAVKARQDYAYGLMGNTKMQGNAIYGPWNALFDTLKGGIGGRHIKKGDELTKTGLNQAGADVVEGTYPGYQAPKPPSGATSTTGTPSKTNTVFTPKTDIDNLIAKVAAENGISPAQLKAYVDIESGGNPKNKTGSYKGLLQLSDSEFNKYGGKGLDIFNPEHNLSVGARKIKAEGEAFKQKYGRDPTPTDLYMIHQQGEGGYQQHTANPTQKAWINMFNTAEGQKKGPIWAQKAIWGNIPDAAKKKFGSVQNVTSQDFMNLWDARVNRGMGGSQQQTAQQQPEGEQLPPAVAALLSGMGQQQQAQAPPQAAPPMEAPPIQGKAPPPQGMMNLGAGKGDALSQTPQQVSQLMDGGGKGGALGDVSPSAPPTMTPPAPSPGSGMMPPPQQPAAAPPQQAQQQPIVDLPINPRKGMAPEALQKIMSNPYIDPAIKKQFLDKAMTQGEMKTIKVDGGELHFNEQTGKQTFVPIGKEGTFNFKGMQIPTYTIKDKGLDKPPSTYFMLPNGSMVDSQGKEVDKNKIMKAGGPQDSILPPVLGKLQEEGLAMDTREAEVKGLNEARGKVRGEHIKAGEDAFKLGQTVKLMRELENSKESENIDTGPYAQTWLNVKKTINDLVPGTFKEGPLTVAELFKGIADVMGSQTTRGTDPSPTLIQFQKIIEATPGILQTPNGRRTMIAVLENAVKRDKEIGRVAIQAPTMEKYLTEVDKIKEKYDNMEIIPKELLQNVGGEKRTIPSGQRVKVTTEDEYNKLPSGTPVIFPDGKTGVKK